MIVLEQVPLTNPTIVQHAVALGPLTHAGDGACPAHLRVMELGLMVQYDSLSSLWQVLDSWHTSNERANRAILIHVHIIWCKTAQ